MPHGIRRSVFSRCATDALTTATLRLRPLATWPQWPDPAGQACTAAALPADPMRIAYRTHVDALCAMLNELLGYNQARPVRPNICCRHSAAVVRTALWTAQGAGGVHTAASSAAGKCGAACACSGAAKCSPAGECSGAAVRFQGLTGNKEGK